MLLDRKQSQHNTYGSNSGHAVHDNNLRYESKFTGVLFHDVLLKKQAVFKLTVYSQTVLCKQIWLGRCVGTI